MEFVDIGCQVETRKTAILQNVTGSFKTNEICALMGPSGAGKTTLLHILAGREVGGIVTGSVVYHDTNECGFVTQEDVLEPRLTCHEVLTFYSQLRLAAGTTAEEIEKVVQNCMDDLGLNHVAHVGVGGDALQGVAKTLSGGEKRRVSIGCSLVTNPSIFFLDEPTSGLDAGMALEVMDALVVIARQDRTIVCSIHQPRWDIFKNFDKNYFLAHGVLASCGTRKELFDFYLSEFPSLPKDMKEDNLADLYLDYLSHLSYTQAVDMGARFQQFAVANKLSGRRKRSTLSKKPAEFRQRVPLYMRCYLVLRAKALAHCHRRGDLRLVFLGGSVWLLVNGLAFSGGSTEDETLYGAVLVLLLFLFFKGIPTMANVVVQRKQYLHDHSMGLYGAFEFWFAVSCLDLIESFFGICICYFSWCYISGLRTGTEHMMYGAATALALGQAAVGMSQLNMYTFPNVTLVAAIYGGLVSFLMAYSGVYCDVNDLPSWLSWIPDINPYYYATSAMMQNQFSGTDYGHTAAMESYFNYSKTECLLAVWIVYFIFYTLFYLSIEYQLWLKDYSKMWKSFMKSFKRSAGVDTPEEAEKESLIEKTSNLGDASSTFKSSESKASSGHSTSVVQGPPITWYHIQYTITVQNKDGPAPDGGKQEANELSSYAFQQHQKVILADCSGAVPASTLCALMGPSGAGKTSLLHILGGKEMVGQVTGTLPDIDYEDTGFVWQEDILEPACTVRETLRFYADLKLPARTRAQFRTEVVQSVLEELGLAICSENIVGGTSVLSSVKTLSGGQRRRVSIGCALVTNPSAVMLDEPTSGLDAGMSLEVMESMRNLVNSGRTMIASIHQPRVEIFKMFDQVIFLAKGHIAYAGPPTLDGMSPLFGHLFEGRDMSRLNSADLMLDHLSVVQTDAAEKLSEAYKEYNKKINKDEVVVYEKPPGYGVQDAHRRPPFYFRLKVLLGREWSVKVMSNHTYTRVGVLAIWGIIFAMPYLRLSTDLKESEAFDTIRALYVLALFQATLTSHAGAVHEHWVHQSRAEMKMKLYEPAEAYLSFYVWDSLIIVIPGSMLMSLEMWTMSSFQPAADKMLYGISVCCLEHLSYTTIAMFLIVAIPNVKAVETFKSLMYASLGCYTGFLIKIGDIPWVVRWLCYLNPAKYAFAGLMINEFSGESVECDDEDTGSDGCAQGDDYVKEYDADEDTTRLGDFMAVLCLSITAFLLNMQFIMRTAKSGH